MLAAACSGSDDEPDAPLPARAIELNGVGFDTPESAFHDSVADVYLVSNIVTGDAKDDNGFISVGRPSLRS